MKFKLALQKNVSSPDQFGWVEIYDFTPINDQALASHGRLVALISSKGPMIGKEIFSRIHEEYFNKTGDPFKLLGEAVQKIHKTFTSPSQSLQILVAIILDDQIFFAKAGLVQSFVIRNNVLAQILKGNNEFEVASGQIIDNDVFILGTNSFFASVTPELLKSSDFNFMAKESTVGVAVLQLNQIGENLSQAPVSLPVIPIPAKPSISPIRIALANFIDKIIRILPQKDLSVESDLTTPQNFKRKKIATTAGIILLILLVISIIFGIRQQKISGIKAKYEPILASASHDLDQAQSLSSLDIARARDLLLQAKGQIEDLENQKIKDNRIADLANKIEASLGSIAGVYEESPSPYLDLSILSSGLKGDDMKAGDDRFVVLDKDGKRLVSIDFATKKTQIVAGPDIMPNANNIALYSDRNFVSASDGIWIVADRASNIIKPEWGTNSLIAAYTGNFYVLDKSTTAVWRYQGDGGVFGTKANWFGPGIKPDLSNVIAWTIDGSIWMLTKDGTILKFANGSPVEFSIKDLDRNLGAKDITAPSDSKYLYILDNANSRVLVIDKDGNYKAQYLDNSIKNATNLVVSESTKQIILLAGEKLFSLDIKHLD